MHKSKVCSAIALFLNAENPLRESPKTNGTGPYVWWIFDTLTVGSQGLKPLSHKKKNDPVGQWIYDLGT
jgi:hypothetical protein